MSDAAELHTRVRDAFSRIEKAAEKMATAEPAEDLSQDLEVQKAENARLEERILTIEASQSELIDALRSEISELKAALGARDEAVKSVRQMNGKLRRSVRALRQANAKGLSDAALIDESVVAELDALRALQRSDRAEIDDLISAITPFVEEAERA